MKAYSITMRTAYELYRALGAALTAGTFTVGKSPEEFAANVDAYLEYCDNYGCRVLSAAKPDQHTLSIWFGLLSADSATA
jgi:hypothetical protein